jgi:hypothetical protein
MLCRAGVIVGGCALAALFGEAIARFALGLGDPPLYESSDAYEYRLRPNQQLWRFGKRIEINALGQRSAELPTHRSPSRRRVLVIGDSVVWGGSQLDQSLIATELVHRQTGFDVVNVAAPSWGPANQLAYLQTHGLLEATDVVLVISSHDAFDVPTFEPLARSPDKPTHKPWSALQEGVQRYLLPRIIRRSAVDHVVKPEGSAATQSLADLLALLARSGVRVGVLQYWEQGEIRADQPYSGHAAIAHVLQDQGIQPVQAGPIFRRCGPLATLFTDAIHPYTAAGQACLARSILQALPPS